MKPRRRLFTPAYAGILLLLAAGGCGERNAERGDSPTPASDGNARALAAWEQIAAVLQHPRCLNCHQAESPLQGAGRAHIPHVVRGADNLGATAMRCTNCHNQSGNNPTSGVPGAPHWSLAPRSMTWAGLSSAELCRALIDPKRNGGRSAEQLLQHNAQDKLVLWGWHPGGEREPVPLPHAEFVQQLKIWMAAGMPCPEYAERESQS